MICKENHEKIKKISAVRRSWGLVWWKFQPVFFFIYIIIIIIIIITLFQEKGQHLKVCEINKLN